MLLSINRIDVYIALSHILRNVSLNVGPGEVAFLIGRNGAGKTTTLLSILGFRRPARGSIEFKSESLLGLPPQEIAQRGLGYSPEESRVFPDLTVQENIAYSTYTRKTDKNADERIRRAYDVFPKLAGYRNRKGNQLSGGERKMLSIARALALDPALLLLDEPFEGLSPAVMPQIAESIHEISKMGVSVLAVESNMYHVPDFATRLYVIERGEIIFSGRPEEVLSYPEVLKVVAGTT